MKNDLIDVRVSMYEGEVKPLEDISEPAKSEFQKTSVKRKLLNEFEFYASIKQKRE